MTSRNQPSRLAAFAVNACLLLHPRRFRAAYAAEMLDVFGEHYAERARERAGLRRAASLSFLVVSTCANLMVTAAVERLRSSTTTPPNSRHRARAQQKRENVAATSISDMRFAVRLLRRQPGFATVAIVTLAIGIGANSAIFSLVNGVLFRSMPYEQPERLVTVWTSNLARGVDRWGVSLHDYTDW